MRGQQQQFRTELGNRMVALATSGAKDKTMESVKAGKMAGSIGTLGGLMSEWHQVQVNQYRGWRGPG